MNSTINHEKRVTTTKKKHPPLLGVTDHISRARFLEQAVLVAKEDWDMASVMSDTSLANTLGSNSSVYDLPETSLYRKNVELYHK